MQSLDVYSRQENVLLKDGNLPYPHPAEWEHGDPEGMNVISDKVLSKKLIRSGNSGGEKRYKYKQLRRCQSRKREREGKQIKDKWCSKGKAGAGCKMNKLSGSEDVLACGCVIKTGKEVVYRVNGNQLSEGGHPLPYCTYICMIFLFSLFYIKERWVEREGSLGLGK